MEARRVTQYYRFANREMLSQSGERTLIPTIIPPGVGHVHTIFSTTCRALADLVGLYGASLSLPVDFRVKSTGMGHANKNVISQFPLLDTKLPSFDWVASRALGSSICAKTALSGSCRMGA
jgi:hypothetical protein